jgi:trans-aconitate 2-methyltransferase
MTYRDESTAADVRSFYEQDFERRVQARVKGNLRIDRALDFILPRLEINSRVLDIGCGIGIATERIANRARKGVVFGVDISPSHVAYCRKTISATNITFHVIDILKEFDKAGDIIGDRVDLITLIDVVEHLPRAKALDLFDGLGRILSSNGRILLTYPSPEYQRRLYSTPGSRLQAVDLIVEISDILEFAAAARCQLRSFQYVDVWLKNQYIHCELVRTLSEERVRRFEEFSAGGLDHKVHVCRDRVRTAMQRISRPWLRYKYLVAPRRSRPKGISDRPRAS